MTISGPLVIITAGLAKYITITMFFWLSRAYKSLMRAVIVFHWFVCLHKMHLVDGPMENIKVTTPDDFYSMRALLDAKENEQIYGE